MRNCIKVANRLTMLLVLGSLVLGLVYEAGLWQGIADGERFYFAHSYCAVPAAPGVVAGTTEYPAPFTCAVAQANIFATQFHPEKSHRAGLQLLANFVAWDGRP